MINPSRIRKLNGREVQDGRYVLYWMQASARVVDNPALLYAVRQADELGVPVLVVFGLTTRYPEANLRHFTFLIEGLQDVEQELEKLGIRLAVLTAEPDEAALRLAGEASLLVTDRGYLSHQRRWRAAVAEQVRCPVYQVEGDLLIPIEEVSGKSEWAAATIRRKIHRLWEQFLVAPDSVGAPHKDSLGVRLEDAINPDPAFPAGTEVDRSVQPVASFKGGSTQAFRHLELFCRDSLRHYHSLRNDPGQEHQSNLSPYLHFGQISPLSIALRVKAAKGVPAVAKEAFLEELIVRRELAFNFVYYEKQYDRYTCLPAWAKTTLDVHRRDRRPHRYTRDQLVSADTHDPYWNAAMEEMRLTGKMHGYMRMYWGKKILEWSETPEQAFDTALYLNNRYFLDGRDANSYAGVAWCFGLHDRPWPERPVFGKVRYMADSGLRRKFDMDSYLRRINALMAD
ncbi:MAG: deoxyribodipyrimidine photo-lyase [Spirochaetaceae bacterium]|nr:MAG: deoxyribodipyrimidine photo-lyase [Spirochaetaceae bacterium]